MLPDRKQFHLIVTAFKSAIAALMFAVVFGQPAWTQDSAGLDASFADLARVDNDDWRIAESDILRAWSKSGSAAMDLLLQRGEDALDQGDIEAAIGHLTALTDHAPEFAAGWSARGAAYAAAGYFGPAIDDLGHALVLEPKQFAAMTQLGMMLEESGDVAAAMKIYQQSLKIHPHQQEVIDALARLEQVQSGKKI